ncbi:MAG: hypothetical protein ACYTF1_08245 [Planctomycetota bacterium]|jgi:hypothetical protein
MQKSGKWIELHMLFYAVFMVTLGGCRHADLVNHCDHVVASPISRRANIVLANLIQDCPTTTGKWVPHRGDPGCVELFGTLFAYRTGVRRKRDDLVVIGRLSAKNESDRLMCLINRMIWGKQGMDLDEFTGIPALLVSGTSGSEDFHYGLFVCVVDKMLGQVEHLDFSVTQNAATAYLLAEMYRQDSSREEIWIKKARLCANRIGSKRWQLCFSAFAWAAIAKSTRGPDDISRAKEIIAPILPKFRDTVHGQRFEQSYSDCLSCHLFLTHSLADMAQIEPTSIWRYKALEILDYVFSDIYFDGRFLAHHIENNKPSEAHCTGCNFHALYLADRLFGDTLVLDPVGK